MDHISDVLNHFRLNVKNDILRYLRFYVSGHNLLLMTLNFYKQIIFYKTSIKLFKKVESGHKFMKTKNKKIKLN